MHAVPGRESEQFDETGGLAAPPRLSWNRARTYGDAKAAEQLDPDHRRIRHV
jgi:hypothetical protein